MTPWLAGLALLLCAEGPGEIRVEVSAVEGDEAMTPRELVHMEDALVAAFNTDGLHLETRRLRSSRIPYAVYQHAQELTACANPNWNKARVMACVDSLEFPNPSIKPAHFTRVTHLLRIARQRSKDGETLALSLSAIGKEGEDKVLKRTLAKDATPEERRTAALEMAGELLAPLRAAEPPAAAH